ncbi:hypothetical protein LTR78_010383 [Recurvomyces mirabilis]|uniref:Protein kinase domain-containing protein n=1 Tax=Recurvomyces mirabilis TaxID=574656 RepID=A0AAE0TMZ9_9PEZI|nr:hypothetical protein LTR78_010383 [Recurvomyces mirabilis]KAK5150117.1 hypothetical protein LTS14_010380 [Recurvomyces mirabilis]
MLSLDSSCARLPLDFASLTPADRSTALGAQMMLDNVQDQPYNSNHHKKFVRSQIGGLAAPKSPTFVAESSELTDGNTTEADLSDDEEAFTVTACYVLSLEKTRLPLSPEVGYWFGYGDCDRYGSTGGVDIAIMPANFENIATTASAPVYARHGFFAFDPTHGSFWLHARHKGIRVDDHPIAAKTRILLGRRMRISIGPHRFIFEYKVSDEAIFQDALRAFFAEDHSQVHLNEETSATPSTSDVRIDDWVLHGVVGSSMRSVIHAASNVRSGEVVAVKRLRFGSSQGMAEREVEVYNDILESVRDNRYNAYVMQARSVLSAERPYNSTKEVYLLWKPLARMGDFSAFGTNGRWRELSRDIRIVLFVQVALGLSALHDAGWIHRDLKPPNLGIVELGENPRAVIIDQGGACRQKSKGHVPKIKVCGTVGYLAPELESDAIVPCYGMEVDIWSLGVVAYYLFVESCLPWSLDYNMFVPSRNALEPSLHLFRQARSELLSQPMLSLERLIGDMLTEDPRKRPGIQDVLAHAALRHVRVGVDARLEATKHTGQKRGQGALYHEMSDQRRVAHHPRQIEKQALETDQVTKDENDDTKGGLDQSLREDTKSTAGPFSLSRLSLP